MLNLDPAWIALIGTVFGGVGLKFIEHWLGKSKIKIDEATRLRDELRIQITSQHEEIKALEAEVDKWKDDYYKVRDEFMEAKTKYLVEVSELNSRLQALQSTIESEPKL